MNKILILTIISLTCLNLSAKGTYNNPVIPGDLADPTIISANGKFYAACTSSEWAPHYPIYSSADLVNWVLAGHVFDKKPDWTKNSFWAPELYEINGKYYCYYTARQASNNISYIGVATADKPEGPYTDHGVLIKHGSEAIDAFVFNDNGQLYISWKAYGLDPRPIEIVASKLSSDGLSLEGEQFSLLVDDENIGMEGQYHFRKGDYYYIVYACHNCCGLDSNYDVYVARSKNFAGPYEKYKNNPILYGDRSDFISCGHGTAVILDDNRMFYLCHAYKNGNDRFLGRQAILHEMYVGDDNWVHFTSGRTAKAKQKTPFKNTKQKKVTNFYDDFSSKKLKTDWTWNFAYSNIKTTLSNGKLQLSGSNADKNISEAALCIRPAKPNYTYETCVTNSNSSLKGLTLYGDDQNFVAWGIEGNKIFARAFKDKKPTTLFEADCNSKAVYFKIQVDNENKLTFYYSTNGKKWIKANDKPFDAAYTVRWDRVSRPGLIHYGTQTDNAIFEHFRLNYK